jgi:hypothetical protein
MSQVNFNGASVVYRACFNGASCPGISYLMDPPVSVMAGLGHVPRMGDLFR